MGSSPTTAGPQWSSMDWRPAADIANTGIPHGVQGAGLEYQANLLNLRALHAYMHKMH